MSSDNRGVSLLTEAESWSLSELEDRASDLLEVSTALLAGSESSHELRLSCLRVIAEKVVLHISVFDIEDAVLKPFLYAALNYLDEIIKASLDGRDEERIILIPLVTRVLGYTTKVRLVILQSLIVLCVVQVTRQTANTDLNIGDLPTLVKLLPQILMKIFQFLSDANLSWSSTEDCQNIIKDCFMSCKELLQTYLSVFDEIKIRTVLEDELEMLVILCQDLVKFHDVLVCLDFKMCLTVWKTYLKFVSKYQARLTEQLDLGEVTEKISSVVSANYRDLRRILSGTQEDKMAVKVTMKVVHFLRVLQSVAAQEVGRSVAFLDILQQLFLGLPPVPAWLPEVARNNIIAVIVPPRIRHTIMEIAVSQETFLSFLLDHLADWRADSHPEDSPGALLQVCVELLICRPAQHARLFQTCLHLTSAGGLCLERPKEAEGRQVRGRTVVTVSWYCWVVSHLGFYLSTLDGLEFAEVEMILLRTLLDQAASLVSLMLISDLWCFLARFSSSALCLAHIKMLKVVRDEMMSRGSSRTGLVMDVLVHRLAAFLTRSHKAEWKALESEVSDQAAVEDQWIRLATGGYSPGSGYLGLQNLIRLTEVTIKTLPSLSEEAAGNVLLAFHSLVEKNRYQAPLTDNFLQVVRKAAVVPGQSSLVLTLLYKILHYAPSSETVGHSGYFLQINSVFRAFKVVPPGFVVTALKSQSDSVPPTNCICGWSEEKTDLLNTRVNHVRSEESPGSSGRIPTPEGDSQLRIEPAVLEVEKDSGKSPEAKKRKLSEEKENIELAVIGLEDSINFLLEQNRRDLDPFVPSIECLNNRIQDILVNIDVI